MILLLRLRIDYIAEILRLKHFRETTLKRYNIKLIREGRYTVGD